MFQKIEKTKYAPLNKPVLIWDGKCGFCKYWVTRWKYATRDSIIYKTFQEAANEFPDIPLNEFKKASRFIDINGSVYSGPDSAFKCYEHVPYKKYPFHNWYKNYPLIEWFTDHVYNFIAKHRPLMFKITRLVFGNDPLNLKPYWLLFIFSFLLLLFMLFQ